MTQIILLLLFSVDQKAKGSSILSSPTTLARYEQNPGSSGIFFASKTISCLACRTRLLEYSSQKPPLKPSQVHPRPCTCIRHHSSCTYSPTNHLVQHVEMRLKGYPYRLIQPPSEAGNEPTTLNYNHTDDFCSWRFADHERHTRS